MDEQEEGEVEEQVEGEEEYVYYDCDEKEEECDCDDDHHDLDRLMSTNVFWCLPIRSGSSWGSDNGVICPLVD